jgi:hypothetical protein
VNLGASTLSLFGGSSGSSGSSIQSIDLSSLMTTSSSSQIEAPLGKRDFARMTPWDNRAPSEPLSELATSALRATRLINTSLGDGTGSAIRSKNDKELFVLHNGVRQLQALADAAAKDGVSSSDRKRLQDRVNRGIAEINAHAAKVELDGATLISGKRLPKFESTALAKATSSYDTKVLVNSSTQTGEAVPDSFLGDRRFNLTIKEGTETFNFTIDLAELGANPRSLTNVSGLINQKLNDAGLDTRFSMVETKVEPKVKDGSPTWDQRLRIQVGSGEQVSFTAAPDDTAPALYVAGGKTISGARQSVVAKMTDLQTDATSTAYSADLAASTGTATARAMARGPDGSMFVVADATGPTGGATPKAGRDVVLQKLDSTGQVVWTRALGSAATAEGFSIAVGANGTIAVAGAVDGRADSATSTTGNARDSFVAAFDSEGRDLFFHQQGAQRNDHATHVAVSDDGQVFVLGQTSETYGGAAVLGEQDVYLQSFSATGSVQFTQSIGGAGNDAPAGLALVDGQPLVVWNQDGAAQMARFDAATGQETGSRPDLSATGISVASTMVVDDGGRVFLAGASQTGAATTQLAGLDLSSGSTLFTTTTTEPIRALTAAGGTVAYATSALAAPDPNATTTSPVRETRLVGLDAQTGTQSFNRSAPTLSDGPIALSLDPETSTSLNALGLPEGDLRFGDTESLTDRTGLRAGDHFFVAVNGKAAKKIEIVQGETMRTLAAKLNRVLLRDGTATATTLRGKETLSITPAQGDKIELRAGPGVSDALKQLGLDPGTAIPRPPVAKAGSKSVSDPAPVVALDLPATADLSDKSKAKAAADAFDGVLRRIRISYRDISTDPTQVALREQTNRPKSDASSQAAIARYNQQTAVAQDALRRLGVSA